MLPDTAGGSVEAMRANLLEAQSVVASLTASLLKELPAPEATSRTSYLRTLTEQIGTLLPEQKWEDEYLHLAKEYFRADNPEYDGTKCSDPELENYIRTKGYYPLEMFEERYRAGSIKALVGRGWSAQAARTFGILSVWSAPIARALRKKERRLVASTYALCQALECESERKQAQSKEASSEASSEPLRLYRHLRGTFGLVEVDSAWAQLERPDSSGLCCLTCAGLTFGDSDPHNFNQFGYRRRYQDKNGVVYIPEDSEVVCFEMAAPDTQGTHAAVLTYSDMTGVFPPNTLFVLKRIEDPGKWEAPGGVFPMQRLLVCSPTFLPPLPEHWQDTATSKFCERSNSLVYGGRDHYIQGLDALIAKPVLTLAQECDREGWTWTDWKGVRYSLTEEWRYVNGPAKPQQGCTAGNRDCNNEGKTPEDFMRLINNVIRQRRTAGYGRSRPEKHASLTRDEVLALRLYSGPAYQPINAFLRQLAALSIEYREAFATHPALSLSMTVHLLCSAVRKLAAVAAPEDTNRTLWRGVRGVLPPTFFEEDARHMVCAVDMAFMSASKNKHTPLHYMHEGHRNVLWELQVRPESDSAFHCGADISLLSQYGEEEEVLFPPCTMMQVLHRSERELRAGAEEQEAAPPVHEEREEKERWDARELEEGGKKFEAVLVQPCFL